MLVDYEIEGLFHRRKTFTIDVTSYNFHNINFFGTRMSDRSLLPLNTFISRVPGQKPEKHLYLQCVEDYFFENYFNGIRALAD